LLSEDAEQLIEHKIHIK